MNAVKAKCNLEKETVRNPLNTIWIVYFLLAHFFRERFSWTSTIHPGIFLGRALWADSGRFPFDQTFRCEFMEICHVWRRFRAFGFLLLLYFTILLKTDCEDYSSDGTGPPNLYYYRSCQTNPKSWKLNPRNFHLTKWRTHLSVIRFLQQFNLNLQTNYTAYSRYRNKPWT